MKKRLFGRPLKTDADFRAVATEKVTLAVFEGRGKSPVVGARYFERVLIEFVVPRGNDHVVEDIEFLEQHLALPLDGDAALVAGVGLQFHQFQVPALALDASGDQVEALVVHAVAEFAKPPMGRPGRVTDAHLGAFDSPAIHESQRGIEVIVKRFQSRVPP